MENDGSTEASPALMLVFFIFLGFFFIIILGVLLYGTNVIDGVMSSINIKIGNVNFNETYNQTIKPVINDLNSTADTIGIAILLGMVVCMLLVSFLFRKTNRLYIILDIFIIIVAFIISVVLQNSYNTLIHGSEELLGIYSNNLQKSSTFLLRLPLAVSIIGVLILIVSYATINKKREVNVYDYIQQ